MRLLASPSGTKPFLFRPLLAWSSLAPRTRTITYILVHTPKDPLIRLIAVPFLSLLYIVQDNKRRPPKSKAITLIVFIATPSSPDRALMWLHPRDSYIMEPIRHVSSLINTKYNKRPLFPGNRRPCRWNIMRASSSSILAKKKSTQQNQA